jgi:hypothetical protein
VADLAYKLSALPIIGEMGMYNTITGSNPVLTTTLQVMLKDNRPTERRLTAGKTANSQVA